jgi:hypothetical protein
MKELPAGEPIKNDHYISQALLRRFTNDDGKFMRCWVRAKQGKGVWSPAVPSNTFSHDNYNAIKTLNENDRNVDKFFSVVENNITEILATLDSVEGRKFIETTPQAYNNLCWYCAFLYTLSPLYKAACPLVFLTNLNQEIAAGGGKLIDNYMLMQPTALRCFQKGIAMGRKIVFTSENYLNLVHRVQLHRECQGFAALLRKSAKFSVLESHINLPLSDSTFVGVKSSPTELMFVLPVKPLALMTVVIPKGPHLVTGETKIYGGRLRLEAAEYTVDSICLTAQKSLISKVKIDDVAERRARCGAKWPEFKHIKNPDEVLGAGLKDYSGEFRLRIVTKEAYDKFEASLY